MAGKAGDDVFAEWRLIIEVQNAGVDTHLVSQSSGPSGSATILILPSGENMIITSAGANAELSDEFAINVGNQLQAGDFLLCQLETRVKSVFCAIKAARRKQAVTIVDPAPACALSDELLSYIDVLTPNQTEAAILLGVSKTPRTSGLSCSGSGAYNCTAWMGRTGCRHDGCRAIPSTADLPQL